MDVELVFSTLDIVFQISGLVFFTIVLVSLTENRNHKALIILGGVIWGIASYLLVPISMRNNAAKVLLYLGLLISFRTPIMNFIKKLPAQVIRNAIITELILIPSFLIMQFAFKTSLLSMTIIVIFPITQALLYAYLHRHLSNTQVAQN